MHEPGPIERWRGVDLPPGIEALAEAALAEDEYFLTRCMDEWASGVARFDGPGECLFVVMADGRVVATGGVACDPFLGDLTVGRLRHIYVDTAFRGRGIAERIVRTCLAETGDSFRMIRLTTRNPAAARIYERLGFRPYEGERATHWMPLRGGPA